MENFNVLLNYYTQSRDYVTALATPGIPPQIAEFAIRIMGGLTAYMEDLLADSNIQGRGDLLLPIPTAPPPPIGAIGSGAPEGDVPVGNFQPPSEAGMEPSEVVAA
jgi:hypothetical protein